MHDPDAARLLLDTWKFRQQHCWASLQRYSAAAVVVSIVPYVDPGLTKQLGRIVLVFPAVGWLIGIFAVWYFAAEYVRCFPVHDKYYEALGSWNPEKPHFEDWKHHLGHRIGWATVYVLAVGFSAASVVNVVLVLLLGAGNCP